MYTDIKDLIIDVIKKQTAIGMGTYPKAAEIIDTKVKLSPKALKAKEAIEKGDFGCRKESVAELVSAMLGETIEVEADIDDDDPGVKIGVPDYALIVCTRALQDSNSEDISPKEVLLNLGVLVDSYLDEHPANVIKSNSGMVFLSKDSIAHYTLEDVYDKNFRFATEDEIFTFVKKINKTAITLWFKELNAVMSLV